MPKKTVSRPSPPGRRAHRTTACLLSAHPFVLDELVRLVGNSTFHVQTRRVESTMVSDLKRLAIPRASVYVVDGHLPRPVVEALVAGMLERYPAARLLVLAERFNEKNAFPLLRLGVKGLVRHGEARTTLPLALEAVATGGFWVPRSLLSRFMDSVLLKGRRRLAVGSADMSEREKQVLEALLDNLANKEIAERLHISERTVKFHVSNLLAKFGVQNRQHLILHCLQVQPSVH